MITKTNDKDKGKKYVRIRHNLGVLLSPDKITPENIEKLKKKYEHCTGKVSLNSL